MKRLRGFVVLAVVAALLVQGCGTVIGRSGLQPLTVHINPEGAPDCKVKINSIVQKGNPNYLIDSTKNSNRVDVETSDGRHGSANCPREVNTFVVICDAFMLIFPILIDYLNGGLYIVPTEVVVNLGKPGESSPVQDVPPRTGPNNPPPAQEMRDCPVCGEKRPLTGECPHCGVK